MKLNEAQREILEAPISCKIVITGGEIFDLLEKCMIAAEGTRQPEGFKAGAGYLAALLVKIRGM